MRVITYLVFTLLSILIQFCVMDYIQEKLNYDDKNDLNATNQGKTFEKMHDILKQKPHTLYYRTSLNNNVKETKVTSSAKVYSNISIPETELTTMTVSTIFEEFYDDNVSSTEDTFTTETFYTTTDIDNVTEISFFDKKNQSTVKEKPPKKSSRNINCACDLLYQICDINCCCDSDCTEMETKLFMGCKEVHINEETTYLCYPFDQSRRMDVNNYFENLFCIVKTNLPDKRIINSRKYDNTTVERSYKWHSNELSRHTEFQRKSYTYGDTIWVLKEGSIWYIDIPSPMINNYCSRRKPMLFLKEESIKCDVNLKDLEMLQVLKTSQEASCISVTEKSSQSSVLNCSTFHCTNWTIIVCNEDGEECVDYNKTLHEPSCTENYCTNIAFRLDYTFYYFNAKIINASITFYTQTISSQIIFMTQEINVRFLLTNESIDKVVKVSGNPGYIYGLPIISSMTEKNHTSHFFNSTFKGNKYLSQPINKDGACVKTNITHSYVEFGVNKRIKCKYIYNKDISKQNSTNACDDIESNIKTILGLNDKIYISPLGNPINIKENDWLIVQSNMIDKELTYGHFLAKNSRLRCYNLITRISYVFIFTDVSEMVNKREDKIIGVNIIVSTRNVTLNTDDVSTVLTIDTNFIDGSKPIAYEYAGGPQLNIHLPKDFFFPFLSNGVYMNKLNLPVIMSCITLSNKITP